MIIGISLVIVCLLKGTHLYTFVTNNETVGVAVTVKGNLKIELLSFEASFNEF